MNTSDFTLTTKQVCERAGITRQTLWRWLNAGKFPQPKRINPRKLRWSEDQMNGWEVMRARGAF